MSTMNHSIRTHEWVISYTQNDVDTIREQVEQTEAMKRQWLVIAFVVSLLALVGAVVLLSSNHSDYSSVATERTRLSEENLALKTRADQTQQLLDGATAREAAAAKAKAQAQNRMTAISPSVLNGKASGNQVADFARMVYQQPSSRVETDAKPSNEIFRNWKLKDGDSTEIYALVGGFADGKWVVYSNLLSKR